MTEEKAWEEAITDARRTLQAHLDTIDELNRHASHTLRLNAVVISLVVAGLYQTSPPAFVILIVAVGGAFLIASSYFAFRVLHTEPVSGGIPPSIYEDLTQQDVSAAEYYDHIGGVIYPRRSGTPVSSRTPTRKSWIEYTRLRPWVYSSSLPLGSSCGSTVRWCRRL